MADYTQRKLQIKVSSSNIQRKLDTIFFENCPGLYPKLKIEELEVEVEAQKLRKTWLDLEKAEKKLTDDQYRKRHREVNQRIISLGNDLWTQNQTLRQLNEKEGKASELCPNSEGAFVHTLLALYRDPNIPHARSRSEQSTMRSAALEVYKPSIGAPKGKLWCPITGA